MISRPAIVGVIGAIVVIAAVLLNYIMTGDPPSEKVVATPTGLTSLPRSSVSDSGAGAGSNSDASGGSAASNGTAAASEKSETVGEEKTLPVFDVVRVDPEGNTVIAGRSRPNTKVRILDGDRLLGEVISDGSGDWVFVPDTRLKPGKRILTLTSGNPGAGGSESKNAVVLVIPEPGKNIDGTKATGDRTPLAMVVPRDQASDAPTRVLQAPKIAAVKAPEMKDPVLSSAEIKVSPERVTIAAANTPENKASGGTTSETKVSGGTTSEIKVSGGTTSEVTTSENKTSEVRASEVTSPETKASKVQASEVTTPEIKTSEVRTAAVANTARVVRSFPALEKPTASDQAASDAGGDDAKPPVALDTVDYDDKGGVVFSGKSNPGDKVQVYVDNKLVGGTNADAEGRWTLSPTTPVKPGTHDVRVDRVTETGKVLARIELPFVRATPFISLPDQTVVIIQPGNNLWRIASRVYGDGLRYTDIFQANADQIRDPDLIYPGQVFGLPKTN